MGGVYRHNDLVVFRAQEDRPTTGEEIFWFSLLFFVFDDLFFRSGHKHVGQLPRFAASPGIFVDFLCDFGV